MNFITKEVNSLKWDCFVKSSLFYSIFSLSKFLDTLEVEYSTWITYYKNQPLVGIAIQENDGVNIPYISHNFIVSDNFYSVPTIACDAIQSLFSNIYIVKKNQNIILSLHHEILDIRPIWWYIDVTKKKLKVDISYTAIINLENKNSSIEFLSKRRLRDYQKSIKNNLSVSSTNDIKIMEKMYRSTLLRHNIEVFDRDIAQLRKLCRNLLLHKMGELLTIEDPDKNSHVAIFILWGKNSAYVLYWGNSLYALKTGASTLLVTHIIQLCIDKGIANLDLGRTNSLGRSEFKSSFDSIAKPYFTLKIQ